jgi:hypothetical protein
VAESDLTSQPQKADGEKITVQSVATAPGAHHEWTFILALVALGLIVFDVWYVTRDPRVRSPVEGPAVPRPRLPERRPS